MNSNSNYYDDNFDDCRRDKKDFDRSRKDKRHPCPTIVKCSSPGSVSVPVLAEAGTTFTPTSLTLNTACLCNPCTKLDFTSNINIPVGFAGTLSFQIFKQCRNQFTPVPVGPAFTFAKLIALVVGESSTFSFFVCDCDSCGDDCCTYTVVITNLNAIAVGLTVNNATLSATTTCQSNPCNC